MGRVSGTYRFVVDCHPKYCGEIQKYMKGRLFTVKPVDNTWLGDHEGLRKFKSQKEAKMEAESLTTKYAKKLYQVTVFRP